MLTPLHIRDVCLGFADRCKYLEYRLRSDGKYVPVCTKLNSAAFADLQKKHKHIIYKGDNCQGYLLLLYQEQGYDK